MYMSVNQSLWWAARGAARRVSRKPSARIEESGGGVDVLRKVRLWSAEIV